VVYIPGSKTFIADTLSRAYLTTEVPDSEYHEYTVHANAAMRVAATPAQIEALIAAAQ